MLKWWHHFLCLVCVTASNLAAHEPEILVLAFPRSGTHWALYCLGHLLNREVLFNRGFCEEDFLRGIGRYHADGDVNGFIYGAHNPNALWIKKNGEFNDILIVVVRNYRECMLRQFKSMENILYHLECEARYNWLDQSNFKCRAFLNHKEHYINALRCYEYWNPSKRYLIFYEDLIKDPAPILLDIMQMVGVMPDGDTWHFFEYLEDHKRNCLTLYEGNGGSQSKGQDLLYHSRRAGLRGCQQIDGCIEGLFPHYFNKYLSRYRIKSLAIESACDDGIE